MRKSITAISITAVILSSVEAEEMQRKNILSVSRCTLMKAVSITLITHPSVHHIPTDVCSLAFTINSHKTKAHLQNIYFIDNNLPMFRNQTQPCERRCRCVCPWRVHVLEFGCQLKPFSSLLCEFYWCHCLDFSKPNWGLLPNHP